MIKKLLLTILFFSIFTTTFSQSKKYSKKAVLRFNFLGVIDLFDYNLTMGGEYRVNQHWSTGSDVGYIFASLYMPNAIAVRGVLIRPFIRYYLKPSSNVFLEAQFHYKYVTYEVEEWVDRGVVNGVPAFQQLTAVDYNKKAMGVHFLVGDRFRIFRKNPHLHLEGTVGLGYRYKVQDVPNGRDRGPGAFIFRSTKSTVPVLPANLKLCVTL